MLVSMSTDTEWLTSRFLTSLNDQPRPVCDNTFANALRDAATQTGQRDQARELARLARAQRKAGRRQSRASRRASRH